MIRRSEFSDLKEIVDIIDNNAARYKWHVLPLVKRINDLEAENSSLKIRIDELEETIYEMIDEIDNLSNDVTKIADDLEAL